MTQFRGRNGLFKCIGVCVVHYGYTPYLSIIPITSKDQLGAALIEIPMEKRREVALAICPELASDATQNIKQDEQ